VAALAQAALVPSVLDLIRFFDTIPSDVYCNAIEQCSILVSCDSHEKGCLESPILCPFRLCAAVPLFPFLSFAASLT
jgi:hypothetical protein